MGLRIIVLIFFFALPLPVYASCEGASPEDLFNTWYDAPRKIWVTEIGDEKERSFVWKESGQNIAIFYIYDYDDIENRGHLQWNGENNGPPIINELRELSAKNTRVDYQTAIKDARQLISEKTGLKPLAEQKSCPYLVTHVFDNLIVWEFPNIRFFPDAVPHARETKVTIKAQRCFGNGTKTDILAVRWNWECQGEGDALLLIKK